MKFLQKLFAKSESIPAQRTTTEGCPVVTSINDAKIESHMMVSRYGSFELTDAVRPSMDLQIVPQEGYRIESYRDPESGREIPALMAAASKERLFELFMNLLEPLGDTVDAVLESSHKSSSSQQEYYREQIDMPVLKSMLWEFDEMISNDGCAGVAVVNPSMPVEVQFDEHKLLIVYAENMEPFEWILQNFGLQRDDEMKFITEAEHVHSTNDRGWDVFRELTMRLGMS